MIRHSNVTVTEAFGGYSALIEKYLLIAESAELEAESALIEQAKARNG